MTYFDPILFSNVKPLPNEYVITSCITAFSIKYNAGHAMLAHDSSIVSEMIKKHPEAHPMEIIALLNDFTHIIEIPMEAQSFMLGIQKLFAYGHYSTQLFKAGNTIFLEEIPYIFETLISNFQNFQQLQPLATCAVSYILSCLGQRYRDINITKMEFNVYLRILNLGIAFSACPRSVPIDAIRLFHVYFLNTLFSFPSDIKSPMEIQNLFSQIITRVQAVLPNSDDSTFNFIGLVNHLLTFLDPIKPEYSYSLQTQKFIFEVVTIIAQKYDVVTTFIFDESNVQKCAKYIHHVINQENIKFPTTYVPPLNEVKIKIDDGMIEHNQLIYVPTFEKQMIVLDQNQRNFSAITARHPTLLDEYPLPINVSNTLTMAIRLCAAVTFESPAISNCQMIKSFLKIYEEKVTTNAVMFVIFWINGIIVSEALDGLKELLKSGLLSRLIRFAFVDYRYQELMQYVCDLFPYLLSKRPPSCLFLSPLFEYFDDTLYTSTIEPILYNSICTCSVLNPGDVVNMLHHIGFDRRLANNMLCLRSYHIDSVAKHHDDLIKPIEYARLSMFRLIDIMLSFTTYRSYFFDSAIFMDSLFQMVFETNLRNYVLFQIGVALSVLRAEQPTLYSLFGFFKLIYAQGETFMSLKRSILQLLSAFLPKNPVEITQIFLRTNFFKDLISFVASTNEQSNVFKLLDLFRTFSVIRGEMRTYIAEADLFSKLYPLIAPFFAQQIDNDLLNKLWVIVFEKESDRKQPEEIKNAAPLPLIFHLLRNNKTDFLEFLVYLNKCCEKDIKSALEVNSSDFPSHLLNVMSVYRTKHEADVIFDQAKSLFILLSLYSMKGKDMLTLFQNFSALPGNFRPFFTLELLISLLSILQTPYDGPSSFVHLHGQNSFIRDFPNDPKTTILNDFAFFVDIEFIQEPPFRVDLFSFETTNGDSFQIQFYNRRLYFQITVKNKIYQGNFEYQFVFNTWTQIVIQYSKRTLQLYVHGKEQQSLKCPKWQFKLPFNTSHMAMSIKCNIGRFFITKEALDASIIKLLNDFPRTFITSFTEVERSEYPIRYSNLFDLSSKMVCFFNPAISNKGNLVNMVNQGEMQIVGQLFGYSPQARHIMHSIGGIEAIIPLFEQLDMPVLPRGGETVNYEFESAFLPFLLEILRSLLLQSMKNQKEFSQSNGFSLLGYLLCRCKLCHFTPQTLDILKKIFNELEFYTLIEQMLDSIFLNARIWIYCSKELQISIYNILSDYIENATQKTRERLAQYLPFAKILSLLRVYYWSRRSDPDINLLDQPKYDPITKQIEAERPTDIAPIRQHIWKLAMQIYEIRFTKDDATTLCYFSFDLNDTPLTIDILTCLIMFLRNKNKVLLDVLKSGNTFMSFFPLLVSSDPLIRGQCIHIFILINNLSKEDREILFRPFQLEEWLAGIISTINLMNTTPLFADIIFGYLFGLFNIQDNKLVPDIRISQVQHSRYLISYPAFIPLALLTISDFADDLCVRYLMNLATSILENQKAITSIANWDLPFVMFIMHRTPTPDKPVDGASNICLHILTTLYQEDNALHNLPMYINLFSARTRVDYSHILRIIFLNYLQTVTTNATYFDIIFNFMFILPDSDYFYNLPIDRKPIGKIQPVTFQELHQIRYNGESPKISFVYGTRTTADGRWVDAELAISYLTILQQKISTYRSNLKLFSPQFMFTFTLGIGIQHPYYYNQFNPFYRFAVTLVPSNNDPAIAPLFANLMGGLIKVAHIMQQSGYTQPLILIMNLLKQYQILINVNYQEKSEIAPTFEAFCQRIFTTKNVTQKILEKFSQNESILENQAKKLTKSVGRGLTALAKSNERYAEHFSSLNVFNSSNEISLKIQQMKIQLLEFASGLRNAYSQAAKQYRNVWRALSSERGPYFSPRTHHYKLDSVIQTYNMRCRLTENYSFNDHKDASLLRDLGNLDDAQKQYQAHLKQLVMTEFAGDQSVVQMGGDEIEAENQMGREDDVKLKASAKLVTMKRVYAGNFFMTKLFLIFESESKYLRIPLQSITHVFMRKYLLMNTSLEIFTDKKASHFLDFVGGQRDQVLKQLRLSQMPNLKFIQMYESDINKLISEQTNKWVNGKISNFEYLMKLNFYAGRSYHDLAQYPVFPWVLADYTSPELDFNNPESFRDFRLPVGALDEERLNIMKDRMGDDPEEHYLYGSFYSSPAVVMGFLIRMEPFTSLHIELQSGRFDHKDRLFNSIPSAWKSVHQTPMDFRELIPEFYCFPDFLVNSNHFDLGSGVNDVELPAWASSPTDFINKHRQALESPIVSQMLPSWIDLIFGVTSRGPAAEPAMNLFSPNFFDTALIGADEAKIQFVQEYAACFGQAPSQIFSDLHPHKRIRPFSFNTVDPQAVLIHESTVPILATKLENNILTIINSNYEIININDRTAKEISRAKLHLAIPLNSPDPDIVAIGEKTVITSVPWDFSFYVTSLEDFKLIKIKRIHTRPLTSIVMSKNYYATASLDCTVVVWRQNDNGQTSILNKHRTAVNCLAINEDMDILVSCSRDGSIVTSSVINGKYLRTVQITEIGEPFHVDMTPDGTILINFQLADSSTVVVFDQNLTEIGRHKFESSIQSWCVIEQKDGDKFLLINMRSAKFTLVKIPSFEVVWSKINYSYQINTMNYVPESNIITIGTNCGKLLELTFS